MKRCEESKQLWSERLKQACQKVGIKSYIQMKRKLAENGLEIVDNTAWRWWNGHRKPSQRSQFIALDKTLNMEYSEQLFFFSR